VGCYIWYSKEGTGRSRSPPRPLIAVPNVTAHSSTDSVPITVLLCNGSLHCDFNVSRVNDRSSRLGLTRSLAVGETARCFVSLNISLRNSRSFETTPLSTVLIFHCNYSCILYHFGCNCYTVWYGKTKMVRGVAMGGISVYIPPKSVTVLFTCGTLTHVLELQ